MANSTLRLTNKKAAIKISGADATETIALADLAIELQETTGENQFVDIQSVTWTGTANSEATISRVDGATVTPVMILQANAAGKIDFTDAEFNENELSTQDIRVAITGNMQVYLLLRKESGYLIADPQSTLPPL